MRKYLFVAFGVFLLAAFTNAQEKDQSKTANAPTLKVKLHYTGAGPVDERHKIFVVLFDSPDFTHGGGGPPIIVKTAVAKDETVTFSEVTTSPVYAVCVVRS